MFPENPYPPNFGGDDFTPRIKGLGAKKHCKTRDFWRFTPQISGWISTPQIWGLWVFREHKHKLFGARSHGQSWPECTKCHDFSAIAIAMFWRGAKNCSNLGCSGPKIGTVDFSTGTGRKVFFNFFFGLILDPPRVHMLLQPKKRIHWYRPLSPIAWPF